MVTNTNCMIHVGLLKRCRIFDGYVLIAVLSLMSLDAHPRSLVTDTLVNCYDESRAIVLRIHQRECRRGKIVGDAEAATIQERRHAYVRKSIETDQEQKVLGKRLIKIGAGFFVTPDGALLTNAHVIEDCTTLTVSPSEGNTLLSRVKASEPKIDLALLETDGYLGTNAVFAPAGSPLPTEVTIVGYPNHGIPPLRPLSTHGTLVQLLRPLAENLWPHPISIKADIRPGNSGGPALDNFGRVVGVVFAAVDTPTVYKRTGRIVRDVGAIIPNSISLEFLQRHGIIPEMIVETHQDDLDISNDTSTFMARVDCWR